jgi:probable phosphoglycerate mutase
MTEPVPAIFLARHGETAWTVARRHTGLTDIPLTERGEMLARQLHGRLDGIVFSRVLSSPLQRAWRTGELAGFGAVMAADADLVEWDYGDCEGLRTAEIRRADPDWDLFRDGCPGGETPAQIAARADRVIARLRESEGNTLVISSGHFLRVLIARWLGLPPVAGRYFLLGTASVSILSYEHDLSQPVIRLLNARPDIFGTDDSALPE